MTNSGDPDPFITRQLRDHPNRIVAVVALLRPDGKLLLVRTTRLPNHWQPLGGGVENSDVTPAAAAVRELREETGLCVDVSALEHILSTPYDFGEGLVHFFTANVADGIDVQIRDGEIAEVGWFSVDEAVALPLFPATSKFLCCLSSRLKR